MRAQSAAKARNPGASGAVAKPAMAVNGTRCDLASAGGFGKSAQPAKARIAPIRGTRAGAGARTMWVIYLEMGLALALLILIVWWTWPAKRPGDDRDKK